MRAGILLPLLDGTASNGHDRGRALLRERDGRVDADSRAAALFELWFAELSVATWRAMVPAVLRDAVRALHPRVVTALVMGSDLGPGARRDVIVGQAFAAAADRWASRWGRRAWGHVHRLEPHHALAALLADGKLVGEPSGGDVATVRAR